jgi:two-component system, NtrC family, C4-dicarboxylate transport sensor histidine kinase DctB
MVPPGIAPKPQEAVPAVVVVLLWQIEQVLLALVMNAMDALPQGGQPVDHNQLQPRTELRLRNRARRRRRHSPDTLSRLFEPFFTTKETGRSVGLGLAISRCILTCCVSCRSGRLPVWGAIK